jgi:hypothetical protein
MAVSDGKARQVWREQSERVLQGFRLDMNTLTVERDKG